MTGRKVPLRASGWLALVGSVLFAIMGTFAVTSGDAVHSPVPDAFVAAGSGDRLPAGVERFVWGTGAGLVPADVTCVVTVPIGEPRKVDTADAGTARTTAEVAGVGTATVLGVTPRTQAGDLVCEGGGLERFATADKRGGPPGAVLGVFFFAGAVAAALWALVTLTRRRSAA